MPLEGGPRQGRNNYDSNNNPVYPPREDENKFYTYNIGMSPTDTEGMVFIEKILTAEEKAAIAEKACKIQHPGKKKGIKYTSCANKKEEIACKAVPNPNPDSNGYYEIPTPGKTKFI